VGRQATDVAVGLGVGRDVGVVVATTLGPTLPTAP
jgi:hypothetical protein